MLEDDEQRDVRDSPRYDNGDAADREGNDCLNLEIFNAESFELDHSLSFKTRCTDFGSNEFYTLAEEQADDAMVSNEFASNEFREPRESDPFSYHHFASTPVHAAVHQTDFPHPRTYWNQPTVFAEVAEVSSGDLPSVMKSIERTNHPMVVKTSHGLALLLNDDGSNPVTVPRQLRQPQLYGMSIASTSQLSIPPNTDRKFQRWSQDEDDILKQAVRIEGGPPINWKRIAQKYFSNARTGLQCKSRWTKVRSLVFTKMILCFIKSRLTFFYFVATFWQSLQPGIVRGTWTPEEDACILQAKEGGLKWSEIADYLPGRIGEHVRDRYVNVLDPDLKKSAWTPEEDQILFQEQRRIGNKWTQISKVIPGRSENAVKNRWHNLKMTNRRKLRKEAADKRRQEQYRANGIRTQHPTSSCSLSERKDGPFSGDDCSLTTYSV